MDVSRTRPQGEMQVPIEDLSKSVKRDDRIALSHSTPLVSVIIPCYNQAHFLADAIESALAQTHPNVEIIVIDDGSTDSTAKVAPSYRGVRCVRQENQGLSAARNTGLRHSTGTYLVFLDADDRLLPSALKSGLSCLEHYSECAFAVGRFNVITADGSFLMHGPEHPAVDDYYLALLQKNHFEKPAAVMYRRWIFQRVGGFDTSQSPCADYDIYLRISRQFPIAVHGTVVAEYRQHHASMAHNSALMLISRQTVLGSQLPYVKGNKHYERAYEIGVRGGQEIYGKPLSKEVRSHLEARQYATALYEALVLLWYAPRIFVESCKYLPRHILQWTGLR